MSDQIATNGIERHKTAMHRTSLSRPVATALGDGLLSKERSILDYGCGRGVDVKLLERRGYKISGWDPHYSPDVELERADIVNLGYVLNVIEDPKERRETLRRAFALANKLLIVAVRVDNTLQSDISFEDGIVSNIQTFQKLYSQSELKEYVQSVVALEPQTANIGVVYVFKDEALFTEYLARRAYGATGAVQLDLIEEFGKDPTGKQYVKKAEALGRFPLPSEFAKFDALVDFYGSVERVQKYAAFFLDLKKLISSKSDRRNDVLTFLASLRLRGIKIPNPTSLPAEVRADIKANWPNFNEAKAEANAFLFSLGDRESVAKAIASYPYGKKLPEDFYIHSTLESDLPALVRLVIIAAKNIVGSVDYDVLKVRVSGRAVSFLSYDDFDRDPHPRLARSLVAYLPKADYTVRRYDESANRPILHRKDALVGPNYPLYERFKNLTDQEEAAGILGAPNIGFEDKWNEVLKLRKLRIIDHFVVHS